MKQFPLLHMVVTLVAVLPLRAQVVNDGATRTLANVTNTITGTMTVGTNGPPNASYTVLGTTNVALPESNWTSIATRQFDASSRFGFTYAIDPEIAQRFFRLSTP